MKRFFAFCTLLALAATAAAGAAESAASEMARALSAGPSSITAGATVLFIADDGTATTLRAGTNGWTCAVGTKGEVGTDPFCADAAGMQWINDWIARKAAPANATPGIIYMLAGGSDWSATDPWATKGTPIKEPPHWMIMYPYGTASGLATANKSSGTWIMWSGTPYAHLMINQKP